MGYGDMQNYGDEAGEMGDLLSIVDLERFSTVSSM